MNLMARLAETSGFFTRAQAREAGYDDKAVGAAVRQREWHRIRRGYYTLGATWDAADAEQRHRIRSAAVLDSLGDRVALSHVSSALHHGLDVWGLPLDRIHVTRLDGGPGRVEGDVVHHEGFVWADDVVAGDDGVRATSPVRAALETGSRARGAARLVVLDSLLRRYPDAPLREQFELMQRWPFMRTMHVPARMADGASGSAGESVGRWFFWREGLPAPVLQFEVRAADGRVVGISDWAWPEHRLLGEFDGRVKYGRLLRPGQDAGDVVFAEKQRKDEMREITDYAMVRLVWEDWSRPRVTADRLRRRLHRAG